LLHLGIAVLVALCLLIADIDAICLVVARLPLSIGFCVAFI
jgi:hypothetical protein